jgi:hypothetical protein
VARLLAVGADGQGRHVQFVGYTEGRRYATFAVVVDAGEPHSVLCLPEWHPRRPVKFPTALLPEAARRPGAWLRLRADLGAVSAARLNPAELACCLDPGPEICHRPHLEPAERSGTDASPELGRGCGDIVLELPVGDFEGLPRSGGLVEVFCRERVRLDATARVYLAVGGCAWITQYAEVAAVRTLPTGCLVRCRPELASLPCPIPVDDDRRQHGWRWRWWPRELEVAHGDPERFDAYPYDPHLHAEGYILLRTSSTPEPPR